VCSGRAELTGVSNAMGRVGAANSLNLRQLFAVF
jgi:hypothetical protein